MIPPVIHQIWLYPPITKQCREWSKSFDVPGYTHMIWDHKNIPSGVAPTVSRIIRDPATHYIYKADILRYEILRLYGGFYVNPGGTINLYQDIYQYIDLNGGMTFTNGGTINVFGGNGNSQWALGANASLTMNGGTLDFKDWGITLTTLSPNTISQVAPFAQPAGSSATVPILPRQEEQLSFTELKIH